MILFNAGLIFTPEAVILCKKAMGREGARDGKFFIYLLIYSNKLVYLQLITVLVLERSPPKSHDQGYLQLLVKTLKNTS